jgi:hypothetical protein
MTTLRQAFLVCAVVAWTTLANAAENQCTARPLGGDVAYSFRASRHLSLEIQSNISIKDVTEIRVSRSIGSLLNLSRTEGIYRVSRGVGAWGKVEAADVLFDASATSSDGRVLYGETAPPCDAQGQIFCHSANGGKSWINPKFRLEGAHAEHGQQEGELNFNLQAISPQEPLTLFATVERTPIAKSPWERVFARYKLLGLYVSKDGGESWTPFYSRITGWVFPNSWAADTSDSDDGNDFPVDAAAFALAPSNLSVMYGYADGDIVKSIDAGRTWTPLSLKQELSRDRVLPHGVKFPLANKVAFTSEPIPASGRYGDEDAGYEDYYLRQLGLPRQWLAQIIVDPTNESIVYVVAETGIYRTMDGGKNWVLLDLGFDELDGINSVAINQNDPAQIFVGTAEGLYTSHDRGCHFENVIIPPDALRCINPQPLSGWPDNCAAKGGAGVTGMH